MLKNGAGSCNKLLRRYLHLQEYQCKELMNNYGLVTQKFKIITQPSQAENAANDLSTVKHSLIFLSFILRGC